MVLVNKEKNLRNAVEQSIEETRRDFGRRIEEIRSELQEGGPEALEKLEKSLNGLKDDLQSGFDDIHGKFDEELETGRREIREHPLLAVGIALSAGVVLGLLLGKRKD
jgi:ElaB/YqjD/DUF883 family membrane-anchored ribosome-binding protein